MATVSVRKFAISLDPVEVVDFTQPLDHFERVFADLGFERVGTYTWRHADGECMIKSELQRSKDGFFVWVMVQAMDEHVWRLQEIADAFDANVVEPVRRSSV
jgi:hypothetical protein